MSRKHDTRSVAVFGGGIGGLTVAHELLERGFRVTLFEPKAILGGKACSTRIVGSGQDGRHDLPAEHGFRFFPGSYRHVFDSMQRTPFRNQSRGVRGNLVRVPYQQQEYPGCPTFLAPTSKPTNRVDAAHSYQQVANAKAAGLLAEELELYVTRRWQYLTSCDARRDTYDAVSWWEFMEAEGRSQAYQDFIGKAPTNFVAARPTRASMRTLGTIAVQLDRVSRERGNSAAWILNGPTNDVWIDPWLAHLKELGLELRRGKLTNFVSSGGRISRATVVSDAGVASVTADFYVSALPVEAMAAIVDETLLAADPGMARIVELSRHVGWMSGMQYYLDYVPDLPRAHQNYIGSPWAITSVVQSEFWHGDPMAAYGDGSIQAILSVIVSDWESPGLLFGRPAARCTPDEIRAEVWHQMRVWADGAAHAFRDEGIRQFELDAELAGDRSRAEYENHSPLLINVVGSRSLRPTAVTAISNLFLAADYVRTHTDLATMESANEAGRMAANGVMAAARSPHPLAKVWAPLEPPFIGLWKAYDRQRFEQGLPWHADAPLWLRWPLALILKTIHHRYARAGILSHPLPAARRMESARRQTRG